MTDTPRDPLAADSPELKLLVGKTPGQADWLRPVTIKDIRAAIVPLVTTGPPREALRAGVVHLGEIARTARQWDWVRRIDTLLYDTATLDATRPSGDPTCENCGKVAEVDAETGDCRECFASLHTRPSGDEALRAAAQEALDELIVEDENYPEYAQRAVDILAAALATPSSTPDVENKP